MIEIQCLGRCAACAHPYSPKPMKIPYRGERDAPITAMIVYESGCYCGPSTTVLLNKEESKRLNLPSKKWKR